MIPFSIWIKGVVDNASVISDRDTLVRVWVEGDRSITAMYDFYESYEQLFDDLDALGYLEPYSNHYNLSKDRQLAVREYIETFRDFDEKRFIENGKLNVESLLSSPAWVDVEKKAQKLVSLFSDFF